MATGSESPGRWRLDVTALAAQHPTGTGVAFNGDRRPRFNHRARASRAGASAVATSRWAIGVLTLHVLVDSFLDVRRGTSGGDHLVSGTVPTIALAVIGIALGRLRPGGVAAVDVLLGVATTTGGGGAPAAALVRGELRPAAITGTLATAAGVVLIVVGIGTAIRARRRDGGRTNRWLRRGGIGVVMFVATIYVALPVGLGYVVANRSGPVRVVADLGAPHRAVSVLTRDGIELAAAYVPSHNDAAVIVFPGVDGRNVAGRTDMLIRHGYGVLVVEPRGNGASEGDPNMLGWSGEADVTAAVDFLSRQPDVDPCRIGGLGLSVGGELMIQAAAHDERLAAVVSEGAGARSIREDLRTPFPDAVIQVPLSATLTTAVAVFSDSTPPSRLDRLVADVAPRPLLLVWASPGQGGEWFNPNYYEAAGANATIWEIPDSAHVSGLAERPDEYERRVVGFFDASLLWPSPTSSDSAETTRHDEEPRRS